jgi:hypothetical protein
LASLAKAWPRVSPQKQTESVKEQEHNLKSEKTGGDVNMMGKHFINTDNGIFISVDQRAIHSFEPRSFISVLGGMKTNHRPVKRQRYLVGYAG